MYISKFIVMPCHYCTFTHTSQLVSEYPCLNLDIHVECVSHIHYRLLEWIPIEAKVH